MIRYDQDENVSRSGADLLVNTVNVVGVMGAGVAKAIKDRYPEIMDPYQRACGEKRIYPGGVQVLKMKDGRLVVNLASKEHFKDPSKPEWVGLGLINLRRVLDMESMRDVRTVLLPPPGAGLGGLRPEVVQRMIRTYLSGLDKEITVSAPEVLIEPRTVHYAGIGSRDTPSDVLDVMTEIAQGLAETGWTLRSGNAVGADSAFEKGAPLDKLKTYLPWPKDNVPHGIHLIKPEHTRLMKSTYKDNQGRPWKNGAPRHLEQLMTRNGCQVFGLDFTEPTDIVICYTYKGQHVGGTRQAITLANLVGIPVINLGQERWRDATASQVINHAVDLVGERRKELGIPIKNAGWTNPEP